MEAHNANTSPQVSAPLNSHQQKLNIKEMVKSYLIDIRASSINLDELTLKITRVAEMTDLEQQKLFRSLNCFKFVILECESSPNPKENLLSLTKYLGCIKYHKHSDKDGIVSVNYSPDSPGYLITINENAPMHTDGSFEMEPPKLVALQCEIPAESGGLSQIVYAQSVYEYLAENYPNELQNLFEVESLSVKLDGQETRHHYIFEKLENDKKSMIFRSEAGGVSLEVNPKVLDTFSIIKEYVNNPNNQITFKLKANQILVLDNTSVLHGRTSFPKNEIRKLNKLWFDGKSNYTHQLQFGFTPKSSPK